MDAGPVLRRIERPLLGDEKHPELLEELFGLGARALVDAHEAAERSVRHELEEFLLSDEGKTLVRERLPI